MACAVAVLGYAVVLARTAWMCDDAFITLRTVDNFVHGHGLRWNVAERVQVFTHPLWLFVLAASYGITREPFYTTVVVSAAISLAAVGLLVRFNRTDPWAGAVLVAALLVSKSFVEYSTSGLENPLTHLSMAGFVILLFREGGDDRRAFLLVLVTCLAILNRPDNALLFGPALALVLMERRAWRRPAWVAAGMSPLLGWLAFSVVYYGLPYPNTALAKLHTGIPTSELAAQGLAYLLNSLRLDPITLTVTAIGVVAAVAGRNRKALALVAGMALYFAYVVRVGGDFMSGRLMSAPFFLAVALLGRWGWGARPWRAASGLALVLVLGFVAPYPVIRSGADYSTRLTKSMDAKGIADERRYYFAHSGVLNGLPDPHRPAGPEWLSGVYLKKAAVPIAVDGAVGFLGFAAGPGVHIVDFHALCDPFLARLPAARHDPLYDAFLAEIGHPPSPVGWRVGHYLRPLPAGYLRTLAKGGNAIVDEESARLFDDVARITRGAIWDPQRLRTIARMLLRGLAPAPHRPRPSYASVPWDELLAVQPDNVAAWIGRAKERHAGGDLAGAIADAEEAVRVQPSNPIALVAAAKILASAGRSEEALEHLDRAVSIEPRDVDGLSERAKLLAGLGRHREAIEAFRKVAEIDAQQSSDAYWNMAFEHTRLREYDNALEWVRRAEASDPGLATTSLLRGEILAAQGRIEEAIASLRRALLLDPSLERAALDLASLLAGRGERAAALGVLEGFARDHAASPDLLFQLGQLLAAEGRRGAALETWREAARRGHAGALAALEQK